MSSRASLIAEEPTSVPACTSCSGKAPRPSSPSGPGSAPSSTSSPKWSPSLSVTGFACGALARSWPFDKAGAVAALADALMASPARLSRRVCLTSASRKSCLASEKMSMWKKKLYCLYAGVAASRRRLNWSCAAQTSRKRSGVSSSTIAPRGRRLRPGRPRRRPRTSRRTRRRPRRSARLVEEGQLAKVRPWVLVRRS